MPHILVPLCRDSAPTSQIKIAYTLHGHGPVLVVLIPGLCVPASMYEGMASFLAATKQFTTLAIDNRGIGASDVPYSSILGGPGYTVGELARDAWCVVDHVLATHNHDARSRGIPLASEVLRPHVALVGHSMGGMVVQAMLAQRPSCVRYVALLSTHAGGYWNLVPTARLMNSVLRLAWSGFDRDVHATFNLGLHFTPRYLDDCIQIDHSSPVFHTSISTRPHDSLITQQPCPVPSVHDEGLRHRHRSEIPSISSASTTFITSTHASDSLSNPLQDIPRASPFRRGISFVEAKVIEYASDLQVYFGISMSSLPQSLRHPKQFLLHAIESRQAPFRQLRHRRRDIYHAHYTGAETDQHNTFATSMDLRTESSELIYRTEGEKATSDTSQFTYFGHAAVVRSHSLSSAVACALRRCSALVKLVVLGRHDYVITPSSSRALANAIDADSVVEVNAAHFVTDEAGTEITTHVLYGLRKAFFANSTRPCHCKRCLQCDADSDVNGDIHMSTKPGG